MADRYRSVSLSIDATERRDSIRGKVCHRLCRRPGSGRHSVAGRRRCCPGGTRPDIAAIEGHCRDFEELRRLLAEQDAAERELRRACKGRRAALEAQLVDLCEAEGPLGCAEMKVSLRLAKTVPASLTGAAAVLRYVRERYDVGQHPMFEEDGYACCCSRPNVRSVPLPALRFRAVAGDQQ
jgi:hypothetical protein